MTTLNIDLNNKAMVGAVEITSPAAAREAAEAITRLAAIMWPKDFAGDAAPAHAPEKKRKAPSK